MEFVGYKGLNKDRIARQRKESGARFFCFHTLLSHFSGDCHAALEKDGIVARQRKESVPENL